MKTMIFNTPYGTKVKLNAYINHYRNNRLCIDLICNDGEPWCTATVNIDGIKLNNDEVLIKDYSENEGTLALLKQYNIVKSVRSYINNGYVLIPICVIDIDELKKYAIE